MCNWSIIKDCSRVPRKDLHGGVESGGYNQIDCQVASGGCSDWSQEYRDLSHGVVRSHHRMSPFLLTSSSPFSPHT